jgi:hypothetical protein
MVQGSVQRMQFLVTGFGPARIEGGNGLSRRDVTKEPNNRFMNTEDRVIHPLPTSYELE